MRLLYRAQHIFDAQMVLNLLQQHGLRGWVEGAALTGAAGELPVHDVVRVMVHNDDCAAAQKLLRDWESGSFTLPAGDDALLSPLPPPNHNHDRSICDMPDGSTKSTGNKTGSTSGTDSGTDSDTETLDTLPRASGTFRFTRELFFAGLLLVALSMVAGALRSLFFH